MSLLRPIRMVIDKLCLMLLLLLLLLSLMVWCWLFLLLLLFLCLILLLLLLSMLLWCCGAVVVHKSRLQTLVPNTNGTPQKAKHHANPCHCCSKGRTVACWINRILATCPTTKRSSLRAEIKCRGQLQHGHAHEPGQINRRRQTASKMNPSTTSRIRHRVRNLGLILVIIRIAEKGHFLCNLQEACIHNHDGLGGRT